MTAVVFFLAAIGAVAGALGVVVLRNPFYNVLALVVHLVALAVLFLSLNAQFVAAAQVVVYAGAVMVLYVFVVAYVGGSDEPMELLSGGSGLKAVAVLACGALFVELCFAFLGSGLQASTRAARTSTRRLRHARRHRAGAADPVPLPLRGRLDPPPRGRGRRGHPGPPPAGHPGIRGRGRRP